MPTSCHRGPLVVMDSRMALVLRVASETAAGLNRVASRVMSLVMGIWGGGSYVDGILNVGVKYR